jgi:coenzyme F420-reducing hydrogenase gamma subunit
MNGKIKIDIQYFNGCPNSSEMIHRVKEAIKGSEEKIEYDEVLVESNELAEKLKFRGSPTVLINGKDIEGREEPESAALNCRVYENGLPTKFRLKNAFRQKHFKNQLS